MSELRRFDESSVPVGAFVRACKKSGIDFMGYVVDYTDDRIMIIQDSSGNRLSISADEQDNYKIYCISFPSSNSNIDTITMNMPTG